MWSGEEYFRIATKSGNPRGLLPLYRVDAPTAEIIKRGSGVSNSPVLTLLYSFLVECQHNSGQALIVKAALLISVFPVLLVILIV